MPLPRSLVQFALNFFKELLRDVREVGILGNVLTDESVGVLVGFVRYHLDTMLAAYSHDLLGTVIHKNHLIHLHPDIFLEPAWQMAATPSVGSPLLCYPWLVAPVSTVAVSLNLPCDG